MSDDDMVRWEIAAPLAEHGDDWARVAKLSTLSGGAGIAKAEEMM